MGSTITEIEIEIEIDCIDPVKVSGFWSLVLGWEMHHDGDLCWMSATGELVPGDLMLVFAPVPESKTAKNRLHMDVSPFGRSQEDEVTRLIGRHETTRRPEFSRHNQPDQHCKTVWNSLLIKWRFRTGTSLITSLIFPKHGKTL